MVSYMAIVAQSVERRIVVPNVAGSSPVVRPIFSYSGSMTHIQAFILGLIQGITEFIPVSSSAHLKIFEQILGLSGEKFFLFDLFCHLGTVFATMIFLSKEILYILTKDRKSIFWISLAILPLIPIYFLARPLIQWANNSHFLGFFLLISSILLFYASSKKPIEKNDSSLNRKITDVLFIGMMQAIALIPGVSRSGTTISAACIRGWRLKEAVNFSFLLAIPTVMGGSILESYKAWKSPMMLSPTIYLVGFITSFGVGFLAIRWIFSLEKNKQLRPFAWYLLIIGLLSIMMTKG